MPKRRSPLDQRLLLPNKYVTNDYDFGWVPNPEVAAPTGGDERSQQVAVVQHRLAFRLRQQDDSTLAAAVTAKFGFSEAWWSNFLSGKAWMGETVQAAAVGALLDTLPVLNKDPRHLSK